MANNTLEVSLALKSAGFRSEINNIKKDNQLLRAEFDRLSSTVDNFEDTLEGKQARLKLVNKECENAKKMVEIYKKQVEESRKAVENANSKLREQEKVLNSARAYVNKYKDATGDVAKTVAETEARISELEKEFEKQAKAVVSANTQYQNMQIQLSKAEKSVNELGKELGNCANDVYGFDKKLQGLEGQLKEVDDELDNLERSAVDFGAKMSEIGQGISSVGDRLTDLGQKGLSALGSLVSAGAELNAETAQTEMVYGNLGEATQKAINSQLALAETYGLTERQMKQATTEIGSYFKAMGLTDEAIADMLPSQAQLIADLSAFADVDVATALGDYKSALQGNHEAVDKYNIAIGESTINESDYAKSIGKTLSQMTEQEKIQARIGVMMQHSADYTGLASQESEEFTAKMKLLKEQVSEASGTIGETLLPTLTPMIEMVSKVVEKIISWVQENPELTSTILAVVGGVSALAVVGGVLLTTIGMAVISFGAISSAIASAGGVVALFTGTLLPMIATVGAVIGAVVILALAIKSNWDAIKEATTNLIETCAPIFENLKESFSNLWEACQSIYDTVIAPLFQIIGEIVEVCINYCTPLFMALMTSFSVAFDLIAGIWNGIGQPLFSAIMQIIQQVWEVAKPVLNNLASLFSSVFSAISNTWNNILKPVFDVLMAVIKEVVTFSASCFTRFVDDVTWAMNTVLTPIQWVIDKLNDLFGWISKASSKVGDFINSINPFSKVKTLSLDANINGNVTTIRSLDVPIDPIGEVALSGSYYNYHTPMFNDLAKLTSFASNMPTPNQTQTTTMTQDNSELKAILENYLGKFVQAISNFNPTIEVGLNGRKLSEEINLINGQGMKLNERWR